MSVGGTVAIEGEEIAPHLRRRLIFRPFIDLAPGQAFLLVNEHSDRSDRRPTAFGPS